MTAPVHGIWCRYNCAGYVPWVHALSVETGVKVSRQPAVSSTAFRFATVQSQGILWQLKRNCSVSPAQLLWVYLALCALSLGIATFFWLQGATMVMPFAWLEVVVVGAAFLVYSRHATDGERISLQGARLVVEVESGGHLERKEFEREWVRVEPLRGDHSLIELSGKGRSVQVGRYVRPELRPELAREIRLALRAA